MKNEITILVVQLLVAVAAFFVRKVCSAKNQ